MFMKNIVVTVWVAVIALICGEGMLRMIDGYPLDRLALGDLPTSRSSNERTKLSDAVMRSFIDDIRTPEGVENNWFFTSPPSLPERRPLNSAEIAFYHEKVSTNRSWAQQVTMEYNEKYVKEIVCARRYGIANFKDLPRPVAYFSVPDGGPNPHYRLLPSRKFPSGMSTNQYGWRGADITFKKPKNTIRIAFLGSSTTQNFREASFSYPEYVGSWLNMWARESAYNITFETINSARAGMSSTGIAKVLRFEVIPLEPDFAIYYEGSNQFSFADLLTYPNKDRDMSAGQSIDNEIERARGWGYRHSATMRRLWSLDTSQDAELLKEVQKPAYILNWPEDVNERNPDLSHPKLPLSLSGILKDIEAIRNDMDSIEGELILSSFVWQVWDGMELQGVRDWNVFTYLNKIFWPYKYSDMRRMADFQNLVFAKYARQKGLDFLDVASLIPRDIRMFRDAIHAHEEGFKYRAWITFLKLIPIMEKHITSGRLPNAGASPHDRHPSYAASEAGPLPCDL